MEKELLKIINHYGIDNQKRKFWEESGELLEAIIEEQCDESGYHYFEEHIAEEIADVMVMLEQFRLYYDIPSMQITEIMQQKIERQLKRIEEENTNEK